MSPATTEDDRHGPSVVRSPRRPEVPHESIVDETDLDPEVTDRIEGHPRSGLLHGVESHPMTLRERLLRCNGFLSPGRSDHRERRTAQGNPVQRDGRNLSDLKQRLHPAPTVPVTAPPPEKEPNPFSGRFLVVYN
jgi:hypothetical protein